MVIIPLYASHSRRPESTFGSYRSARLVSLNPDGAGARVSTDCLVISVRWGGVMVHA